MSSQSREQSSSERSEAARTVQTERTGVIVEGICVHCGTKRGHRILHSDVNGDPDAGGSFKSICKECCKASYHNITDVYQTVEDPPLGWRQIDVQLE